MNKMLIIGALCAIVAGCVSDTAEWGGEDIVRGLDGAPIVAKDGTVQKVSQPTKVCLWRHWFDSHIDRASLKVTKGDIDFNLNGYNGVVSTNVVTWTDTMFKGAANLATKVGAAIATAGGTAAADSVSGLVSRFVSAGGDIENASVTCKDGSCTISDGSTTCTGDGCYLCNEAQ